MSLRGEHININVYIKFNKINVIFEIFCLHVTGYLNTKESFPIGMFVVMAWGKCELHKYYTFLQRILISTHKKINIFLPNMPECPTFTFQVSIISKWLAKHIRTKVSFKITIKKRYVYTDIRWPWKWNQYFYMGIWEDDRSKIILLPTFHLVTRLNSQNRKETIF